jgi:AcrR family transcriptional regulator
VNAASTAQATRSRMRGADRRRLIGTCAAQLFAEKGYAETSMQDIADAAGVMKGTLYHFYKNKELLLYDVLQEAIAAPQAAFDEILTSDTAPDLVIEQLIATVVRFHRDLRPYMVTFTRESIGSVQDPTLRKALLSTREHFERTWETAVERAIASGAIRGDLDHRIVTFGMAGMVNWMFKWYSPSGRLSADEIAETFGAVLLDGLRPR